MTLTNPQYYDNAMHNPELCKELGCWTAFHRDVAPINPPTREEFLAAAKKGNAATGVLTLTCRRCGTSSNGSRLNKLQQGQGIACFCSGKMTLTNPQYYDNAMHNPELCKELGCWTAFHRDVAPINPPTHEEFLAAAKKGPHATGVLTLTCSRCGTSSNGSCLGDLQQGRGIACGCKNKTEALVWFPELVRQCEASRGQVQMMCSQAGQWRPKHLSGSTDSEMQRRRFDAGVQVTSARHDLITVSQECDGIQHFRDSSMFSATSAENQRVDGAKVKSGFAVGEWNVRYHQEGVWTDAYQWRTFMQRAHEYVAAHGATEAPKVIFPEHYRPEYSQWLTGAGIAAGRAVWL